MSTVTGGTKHGHGHGRDWARAGWARVPTNLAKPKKHGGASHCGLAIYIKHYPSEGKEEL